MVIRSTNIIDFNRHNARGLALYPDKQTRTSPDDGAEFDAINLQDEIDANSEEMADLLSLFGRLGKAGRKTYLPEHDFESSILEDKAEEKLGLLIKNISKYPDSSPFLNYSRSLFPDDSDLMCALRELLLSRKLSELQKKKIKEIIADLEKFCDTKKMKSAINVSRLARRFTHDDHARILTAKGLRKSYLRFIELDIPVSFIYQDWIDEYGFENRKRLLAFTLSALIADIKSNQPGIHFAEFGALSAKLSEARVLHTLDQSMINGLNSLRFIEKIKNNTTRVDESYIINIYMTGLIDFDNFKRALYEFNEEYMSGLLIAQRAITFQVFKNVFDATPDFLYSDQVLKDLIHDLLSALMLLLYKRESTLDLW